jgi:hypothetical protein
MDLSTLTGEQQNRYKQLEKSLEDELINFRKDSDLCWDFVFHGDRARVTHIPTIVIKMKKAKYLHEYCNFELGYKIARNTAGSKYNKLPKEEWLTLLRRSVLLTTLQRGYPQIWPWEKDITPANWKIENDRTQEVMGK